MTRKAKAEKQEKKEKAIVSRPALITVKDRAEQGFKIMLWRLCAWMNSEGRKQEEGKEEREAMKSEFKDFNPEKHLRVFAEQAWEPMYDDEGTLLKGIQGKSGASEIGSDGQPIGVDLIEMAPGSSFPIHTHPGDHILFALSGSGYVNIGTREYFFPQGATFYIAAENPHNVSNAKSKEPFVVLAVGHPQKHVSDIDRMTVVREEAMADAGSTIPTD